MGKHIHVNEEIWKTISKLRIDKGFTRAEQVIEELLEKSVN